MPISHEVKLIRVDKSDMAYRCTQKAVSAEISIFDHDHFQSNPLYGLWNQKTLSCKWPTITGFLIAAIGQVMYGAISEVQQHGKWYMLVARVVTGLGVGNLAALRAYGATASTPKDRLKAISYGTAGYVFGISFGPAISVS